MEEDKDFLRQDNNYRTLKAFQKAECIYDVTYYFANTFLKVGDRTIDFIRTGEKEVGVGRLNFGKKGGDVWRCGVYFVPLQIEYEDGHRTLHGVRRQVTQSLPDTINY